MRGWLRVIVLTPEWLAIYFILFGTIAVVLLIGEEQLQQPFLGLRLLCVIVLIAGAASRGAGRVMVFHPFYGSSYRNWLLTTPWTSRQPLPLGPIHLVPQDLVIMGLLAVAAAATCGDWWIVTVQVFVFIYLASTAGALFGTGEWRFGYAVLFGLGLLVRCWPAYTIGNDLRLQVRPWPDLPLWGLAAAATYAVALVGTRLSLARFPWNLEWQDQLKETLKEGKAPTTLAGLGWPHACLGPRFTDDWCRVPMHHALLIALVAGWGLHAGLARFPREDEWPGYILPTMALFVLALGRMGVYAIGHDAPISLAGRFATGRLIIPKYDEVFMAPLLAMAAGAALMVVARRFDFAPEIMAPVMLTTVTFIILGCGPTLRKWRLTGAHRIVEWGAKTTAMIKVG